MGKRIFKKKGVGGNGTSATGAFLNGESVRKCVVHSELREKKNHNWNRGGGGGGGVSRGWQCWVVGCGGGWVGRNKHMDLLVIG